MTPLGETIRFMEQVMAHTEGRPNGVALQFTGDGGLYMHLSLEGEVDDDPEEWSHSYIDSVVSEPAIPGWVLEYRRLDEECLDPLQSVDETERLRLRSIPDPPPAADALELLDEEPLYPGADEPEDGPLMVLFFDKAIPEAATREIDNESFRRRATQAFRCRRVTSKSPLFKKHKISTSRLNFYSLQTELLASRWLASGTFDEMSDFLDQAIAWSKESVAERKEREVLGERLGELRERRYREGVELCVKALAECRGVFHPAQLFVCSDMDVGEV